MRRFACRDVIPGCDQVFTGDDDESVLDQVIAHAAADHGLVKPPPALVELVVATTYTVPAPRPRNHLHLVGAHAGGPAGSAAEPAEARMEHPAAGAPPPARQQARQQAEVLAFPGRRSTDVPVARLVYWDTEPAQQDGYRHECLFYRGTDEFVAALVPFIRDGLALGQPVMVAVVEPRLSALRTALGAEAASVIFVDMAVLGANPARIIPAWRAFTDGAAGHPTRGVCEPIWAGRRPEEIAEGQFHEALLNLCPDESTPLWSVCPYDTEALHPTVIEEASRSHPLHSGGQADTQYAGRGHALDFFTTPLPEPTGLVHELTDGTGSGDVTTQVLRTARAAGLPARTSARLATAVDAVTGTAIGDARIRVWQLDGALVCQIDDTALLFDPLVGRSSTLPTDGPERGIRLANELCDLVQVRSGAAGTSVRLFSWL